MLDFQQKEKKMEFYIKYVQKVPLFHGIEQANLLTLSLIHI